MAEHPVARETAQFIAALKKRKAELESERARLENDLDVTKALLLWLEKDREEIRAENARLREGLRELIPCQEDSELIVFIESLLKEQVP
jgi:septal ring factor EnvC (AmiA/AmiB activator)